MEREASRSSYIWTERISAASHALYETLGSLFAYSNPPPRADLLGACAETFLNM